MMGPEEDRPHGESEDEDLDPRRRVDIQIRLGEDVDYEAFILAAADVLNGVCHQRGWPVPFNMHEDGHEDS